MIIGLLLFRENAELDIAAIELYRKEEVSLSKAAEIAGLTTIEFLKLSLRFQCPV